MNKEYTLTYDNKHMSGGKRVEISVSHDEVEYYAKDLFKWRSATKRYNSIVERVFSLGSSDYDRLIEFIAIKKGII